MNTRNHKTAKKGAWIIILVLIAAFGWGMRSRWLPLTRTWVDRCVAAFRSGEEADHHADDADADPHAGHDHESHSGHNDATALELSEQGRRNIGLSPELLQPVQLETYRKSITVPAVVVERPGRTRVQVATPMTGVITHVHALEGEAVEPGSLLFQIRLTHEDLVQAQTDFLRTLGEIDVEEREIKRLASLTESGAVAGKLLLDREYTRDKLTAVLRAQREALRLHGLSENQVDQITTDRRLLRDLQVFAPSIDGHDEDELKLTGDSLQPVAYFEEALADHELRKVHTAPLILQELTVHKGQSVNAGETLCVLKDYEELFIEGKAFEQDIQQLRRASEQGWTVEAIFDQPGARSETVKGLEMAYLANQVDTETRTLPFYVHLPNEVTKDRRAEGNRYVEWKYLPGQRLQLRVPVEEWTDQIVLPVDAVSREGAEYYVFQENGKHFDRVPVHVKYHDQHAVVIANDGSLFPGDVVAMRGAHQMQMALKNKSGGGVDPHAGHNH
ncbi:MAG: efflux RND transporter periplasmic adaptor subunit [Planctomycetaceae bacterium]|nr:efflux RND transporter periplasmic adaptor subunit [Planctomycetaceae bacterium]